MKDSSMKTVTQDEFLVILMAQGVKMDEAVLICPACGTMQNAKDLIQAGAGKTFEEVEKYLGFSCVGRFTHAKPPPKKKGTQIGCNWTLGGLLTIHTFEVVTPDGVSHPRFEPATPEDARKYVEKQREGR